MQIVMNRLLLICSGIFIVSCNGHQEQKQVVATDVGSKHMDTTNWPASFGFGKPATAAWIAKIDLDVRPDGAGLPTGEGNATAGKTIYINKCAACHGTQTTPADTKLLGPALISNNSGKKEKTIGNYWPYATTLFDYIRRAMPYNTPGTLTNEEVYQLTAFLLYANKVIGEKEVVDAKTLPKVVMPAQKRFIPDDRHGGPEVR